MDTGVRASGVGAIGARASRGRCLSRFFYPNFAVPRNCKIVNFAVKIANFAGNFAFKIANFAVIITNFAVKITDFSVKTVIFVSIHPCLTPFSVRARLTPVERGVVSNLNQLYFILSTIVASSWHWWPFLSEWPLLKCVEHPIIHITALSNFLTLNQIQCIFSTQCCKLWRSHRKK